MLARHAPRPAQIVGEVHQHRPVPQPWRGGLALFVCWLVWFDLVGCGLSFASMIEWAHTRFHPPKEAHTHLLIRPRPHEAGGGAGVISPHVVVLGREEEQVG